MTYTRTIHPRRVWHTALALATPGVNTVLHDAAHPSRIMLPVQPVKHGTDFGPEPACGELHEERCVPA